MNPASKSSLAAKIILLVLSATIALNMAAYFQAERQLTNPLVPGYTVLEVSRPYLMAAFVGSIGLFIALIGYFFSRYLLTIIISAALLVWQFYYLNWGAY